MSYMYVHIYTYTFIFIYILYVYLYTYIYTYMYACILTYTCTYCLHMTPQSSIFKKCFWSPAYVLADKNNSGSLHLQIPCVFSHICMVVFCNIYLCTYMYVLTCMFKIHVYMYTYIYACFVHDSMCIQSYLYGCI